MISYPDARRFSPNPERDAARKALAKTLREMRRSAYAEFPDAPFIGHAVARSMWRLYRSKKLQIERLVLMEGQADGQKIH